MNGSLAEILFWASAGALIYSYAVYPLLLFFLAAVSQTLRDLRFLRTRQGRRTPRSEQYAPRIAMLVAAYNEESVIEAKLRNATALDYPADRWEFLLGLDAPTDATAERAVGCSHPSFRLIQFPARRGKLAVLRELAQQTSADILVFSDANTMLEPDCLRRLVRHFTDPKVGAVCGELRLVSPDGAPKMESLYWRYEVALKFLENRLECVLGANGAVYAVRRELFHPEGHWIVEDFQVPMEIRFSGHRVIYDPEAIGMEEPAPSTAVEFRRKVRIGAGDYQILLGNLHYLNPLKGWPAFAYVSHKVLRWLGPLFLLTAWVSSGVLMQRPLYAAAFGLQTAFYLFALLGYQLERRGRRPGLLGLPLYFCAVNLALLLGLFRFLSGRQRTVWSSTPRSVPSATAAKTNVPK